jgi:hypothetical protein
MKDQKQALLQPSMLQMITSTSSLHKALQVCQAPFLTHDWIAFVDPLLLLLCSLQGVPSAAVSRMPTSSLNNKDITDEEEEDAPHAEPSQAPEPETLALPVAEASKSNQ